jgi:hypothetical protein
MSSTGTSIPFRELAAIADKLFEENEDNEEMLSRGLEALDPDIRNELLVSDLLNAYQTFYYFFRTIPDELIKERLELEPASALVRGIKIDEVDLLDIIFSVHDNKARVVVGDGEKVLKAFTGRTAYADAMAFVTNPS